MNYITVNKDNIEREHICCAISKNDDCQVAAKKGWLKDRFDEGLTFYRADARGKCFIEYIPGANAWLPIIAAGCMHIDCFWVSGQFKGQGTANILLEKCIEDTKKSGFHGITALSSAKKVPFLSDSGYLKHKGFIKVDEASPFFELYCLKLDDKLVTPSFKDCAKHPKVESDGFAIYYADQCPYTAKYVPIIEALAKDNGRKIKLIHIDSIETAQSAPCAYTSFSLFYNGKFLTHEIPSEKKFLKIMEENND